MFSRRAGSVGECWTETAAKSATVPGSSINLAGFKRSTVISLVLPLMSRVVLVEAAENPEGTIVRMRKWRFMALTPHIHMGGLMDIRRQINSMTAVPSCRNKLEVLR